MPTPSGSGIFDVFFSSYDLLPHSVFQVTHAYYSYSYFYVLCYPFESTSFCNLLFSCLKASLEDLARAQSVCTNGSLCFLALIARDSTALSGPPLP